MKSKNLALLITAFVIIVSYAIVTAHNFTEGIAIVSTVLLGFILTYGLYYSIYDLIKLIRNESDTGI